GYRLTGLEALEDRGREQLAERRVSPALDRARVAERLRGVHEISGAAPDLAFVLVERHLPLSIVDERDLEREVRDRLEPLAGRLVKLARGVDGVLRGGIVLDRAPVVLDRLARLVQRRVRPQPPELLVNGAHLRT